MTEPSTSHTEWERHDRKATLIVAAIVIAFLALSAGLVLETMWRIA